MQKKLLFKASLLPKGKRNKRKTWCILSEQITYLFALYKTAPRYWSCLVFLHASMKEQIKTFFLCSTEKKFCALFFLCVLCMDSYWKLSLIFRALLHQLPYGRGRGGGHDSKTLNQTNQLFSLLSLAAWRDPASYWCQGVTFSDCDASSVGFFVFLFPSKRTFWKHWREYFQAVVIAWLVSRPKIFSSRMIFTC